MTSEKNEEKSKISLELIKEVMEDLSYFTGVKKKEDEESSQ